jgi:hypothetical protein
LTIDNGIEEIGFAAFYECNGFNGNLEIPNSVKTIGQQAFDYCSGFNGNLEIPGSIEQIGVASFQYCGFTSLTINYGAILNVSIYDGPFKNCSNIRLIELRNFSS